MAYKNNTFSLDDFAETLLKGLKEQAKKPNILGYQAHEKQLKFHTLDKRGRLYIGGNRSGKSYGSVAEDLWWVMGNHPYLQTPEPPVRGRVVVVDFTEGLEQIMLPIFHQLIAPSMLKNGSWEDSFSKTNRQITFANKSTIEFMSYEQDIQKFAGTSRHFVHFDEEPPMHIFNECGARLVDTNGRYWISMTPVDGMTWTHETIYEKGIKGDPLIGVVEADMIDNPHITAEAAEAYLSGLDDEERKAREHGNYVALGGLVYKQFHKAVHVIDPFIPPKNWAWYCSLDHGYNAPTGVLWHGVSPEGRSVTFSEHYQSEWTLDQHATFIKQRNQELGKQPDYYVADPAISQRSGITGTSIQTEYAMRGLPFALGNNNVEVGVAKIQNYLRNDPSTGKPWYQITENCKSYIWEMQKLRWKTYASRKMQFEQNAQEKIHKKDDHLCDSARYFFSFLPDLKPWQMDSEPKPLEPPADHPVAGKKVYGSLDEVLSQMVRGRKETTWTNQTVGTDLQGLEND